MDYLKEQEYKSRIEELEDKISAMQIQIKSFITKSILQTESFERVIKRINEEQK